MATSDVWGSGFLNLKESKQPPGSKQLWGPFYSSPPDNSAKYEVLFPDGGQGRNTVDPNSQIGWEQLGRGMSDFLYNIPGQIDSVARLPENYDFVPSKTPFVGPVIANTIDWLGSTKSEFDAKTTKRTGKSSAPAAASKAPTAFSFMESPFAQSVGQSESGGNWNAKNPGSSAAGKYQFVDQTWLGLVKKYGPEMRLSQFPDYIKQGKDGKYYVPDAKIAKQILDFRYDPTIAPLGMVVQERQLIAEMTPSLGRPPTQNELAMGHFLGGPKAAIIAKLPPSATMGAVLPASWIAGNPAVFTKGAATTRAEMEANYINLGRGSQNPVLASMTTQLPGAPPVEASIVPRDFSGADELLAAMQPVGVDEAYIKKMQKQAMLAGWAGGLANTQGGIPGMLARMAAGGQEAQLKGTEFAHAQGEKARQEMLNWQQSKFNLELKKGDQRWEEANANKKTEFNNASRLYQYKAQIASLGKIDQDSNGLFKITEVGPNGQLTQRYEDFGSQLEAFRQANGIGRGRTGGANPFGTSVTNAIQQYTWAKATGSQEAYATALAAEINDSPAKFDILGGNPKEHTAAVNKLMIERGYSTSDRAWVDYITHYIAQQARDHPEAMQRWMADLRGHGIVGGFMQGQ